jgi:hypothetical protein
MSNGVIILSQGVKEYVKINNYNRANEGAFVSFEKSLRYIVEFFIPELGLDYYIENNHIVICTYREAANKWIQWYENEK